MKNNKDISPIEQNLYIVYYKILKHIVIILWLWLLPIILFNIYAWLRGVVFSTGFLTWIFFLIKITWFKHIKLNNAIYFSYFLFFMFLIIDIIKYNI